MCVVLGLKLMLNLVGILLVLFCLVIVLFIIIRCVMCVGSDGFSCSVSVRLVNGVSVIRVSWLGCLWVNCMMVSVVVLFWVDVVGLVKLILLKLLLLCMKVVFFFGWCISGLGQLVNIGVDVFIRLIRVCVLCIV